MKSSLWFLAAVAVAALAAGCATAIPRTNAPKAPVAEAPPQRVFDRVDTEGKGLTDFFEVTQPNAGKRMTADRATAILSASYLLVETGLNAKLPPASKARFTDVFFHALPTGSDTKELVVPRFAEPKPDAVPDPSFETDAYFFLTPGKDSSGAERIVVQTNIPMASVYAPGVYDGYVMESSGKLIRGKVPHAWVSIVSLYTAGNKLKYWGPSMPMVGSPVVSKDDAVKSDRTLSVTVAAAGEIDAAIKNLAGVLDFVDNNLKTETDEKKLASARRLKAMALLSTSLYQLVKGDLNAGKAALNEAKAVAMDPPKSPKYDNVTQLTAVLDTYIEINANLGPW